MVLKNSDFDTLFPFFFQIGANLAITGTGPALRKIFPDILGKNLINIFQTVQNNEVYQLTYSDLEEHIKHSSTVELKSIGGFASFRGHFFQFKGTEGVFFLGNPCITSPQKIDELGLTVDDFALHDTITDTILLINRQQRSNDEIRMIAENQSIQFDLLQKIMDMVPQQIFLKDSDARFLMVNKKMSELFGADIKDILGKTDRDFWPEAEEVSFYNEVDRTVIETGKRFEIPEEPQTHKDGTKRINKVVKMPFVLPNGERCVLGIAIDVTDIKDAEQARFEIASGVLHDIGNAVVGFGSYVGRIKRSLENDNLGNLENLASFFETQKIAMAGAIGEVKAKAVVDMLNGLVKNQKLSQEETKRSIAEQYNIIKHIQEILSIQRQYVTGYQSSERKPVYLRSIVNDCMAMVFASLDKRNIEVSLDIQADLHVIRGDRTKLMQVILNVLKNSVEAIDVNSPEKEIRVKLHLEDNCQVLEVRDTGTGFDSGVAERLFERGFTTKTNGSGIGLNNCRTIVESHNGTMSITSDGPGQGATVTLAFRL